MTENVKKLIEEYFENEENFYDFCETYFDKDDLEIGQIIKDEIGPSVVTVVDIQKTVENVDMEAQYAEQVTRTVFSHSNFPDVLFMVQKVYESWSGGSLNVYEVVPETVQVTKYKVVE